jgi:predicted acetyltransferase
LGETSTLDLAGHIGYAVYLPYRGHHYAAKACVLLFQEAKRFGMQRLIITCNTDNVASYRTCELAGCTFIKTEIVPKDHELYLQGDREKAIFIKTL